MGMRVTCRYCKSKIEKKNAFQILGEKHNTYYCNQKCYSNYFAEKEKTKNENEAVKRAREIERLAKKQEREEIQMAKEEEKKAGEEAKKIKEEQKAEKKQRKIDPVYEEVSDIFGYRTQNSVLFAEMKLWRGICDDAKILAYLQEHKSYIKNKLERLDNNEYSRIKYMSAILKNSLADYNKTIRVEPEKINVDCEIYEPTVSTKRKRRGLNALEDEVI